MAETVTEAAAVCSSVDRNVEVVGNVPDDQVEVSKKDIEVSAPVASRPCRLRKTVDRFIDTSVEEKEPTKKFTVEQGRGTPLKDIPNVVSKIRKRTNGDEIIKVFYTILYGYRGKAIHMKRNILQFSGFVWGENEEKHRGKLHEKLHKYNKEILFNLFDLLDIHVSKSATRKEELVAKLIEFLECPHVNGSGPSVKETTQKSTAKKVTRKNTETLMKIPNEGGQTLKENVEEDATRKNDSSIVENVAQEAKVEEGKGVDEDQATKKTVGRRIPKSRSKEKKEVDRTIGRRIPKSRSKEKEEVDKTIVIDGKKQRRKQANTGEAKKKDVALKEDIVEAKKKDVALKEDIVEAKKKDVALKEDIGEAKKKDVALKEDTGEANNAVNSLSDDDLRFAIYEVIREVTDFENTTYRDVIKILEQRFRTDLSERTLQLRRMVQEELNKLAEEDTDEEEEEED